MINLIEAALGITVYLSHVWNFGPGVLLAIAIALLIAAFTNPIYLICFVSGIAIACGLYLLIKGKTLLSR